MSNKAKKKFGQNFLIDQNILNKLINLTNPYNKNILEIGPGTGNLTEKLLKEKPNKIIAIEIDSDLISDLNERFISYSNFILINEDFLKMSLLEINNLFDNQKYHLIANLPYYISTKIIFSFINEKNLSSISIMLQKELVDRIVANPRTKEFGRLSVSLCSFFSVEKYFKVGKNNFRPIPNVESSFIKLNKIDPFTNDIDGYLNFIKIAFSNRRKTLLNNLKIDQLLYNFINFFLIENNINLSVRAEEIETKVYKKIWKEFKNE